MSTVGIILWRALALRALRLLERGALRGEVEQLRRDVEVAEGLGEPDGAARGRI